MRRTPVLVLASALAAVPGSALAKNTHLHPTPLHAGQPNKFAARPKLDAELTRRLQHAAPADTVDLIAMHVSGNDLPARYRKYIRQQFHVINGDWLQNVPAGLLNDLAGDTQIERLTYNHDIARQDALSSSAVLANAVDPAHAIAQQLYPYTGTGVRVAVIDSGFTAYPTVDVLNDRVSFVNFVDKISLRHDGDGHGTHVTGIIAGTGAGSAKYAGIAPGVSVVSMKVLDDSGTGSIGNVIAALDWIYTHPDADIRIVNLSVGAAVRESYWTDPLTLATKALVDRGITVVAAAGNAGLTVDGQPQWGGITSPGNAPWVLTVCAFSTNGTYDITDDTVAGFSSAGPTAVDFGAKPDLCAPGVGIVSLTDPGSTLYAVGQQASPTWLIGGSPFGVAPYESLSGTSSATPFVSGAVALLLQENPSLTPNAIKAILEYTARPKPGVSPLKQGAGFLNVSGALTLAAAFKISAPLPSTATASWGRQIIWGNQQISGGVINPAGFLDNIIWGTDLNLDNIIWGTDTLGLDNIVWGTDCGGQDCNNVVWGSVDLLDNIIWGTALIGDNIIWGTDTLGLDNIIWGTDLDLDNIIWGTTTTTAVVWPISAEAK